MNFLQKIIISTSLCFVSISAQASIIQWANDTTGLVPNSTIGYTISSSATDSVPISANSTWDNEHSWGAGGAWLRRKGGDWSATITFDAEISSDQFTFFVRDVDAGSPTIELMVTGGTADTSDFSIDEGAVDPAISTEYEYNPLTGIISAPISGSNYHSQFFGNSIDTFSSLTLTTSGVTSDDWTAIYFGFVLPSSTVSSTVPEPNPIILFLLGLASFGFSKNKRV